jgi:hypothetical protein
MAGASNNPGSFYAPPCRLRKVPTRFIPNSSPPRRCLAGGAPRLSCWTVVSTFSFCPLPVWKISFVVLALFTELRRNSLSKIRAPLKRAAVRTREALVEAIGRALEAAASQDA